MNSYLAKSSNIPTIGETYTPNLNIDTWCYKKQNRYSAAKSGDCMLLNNYTFIHPNDYNDIITVFKNDILKLINNMEICATSKDLLLLRKQRLTYEMLTWGLKSNKEWYEESLKFLKVINDYINQY
jgi:hypothetical protein